MIRALIVACVGTKNLKGNPLSAGVAQFIEGKSSKHIKMHSCQNENLDANKTNQTFCRYSPRKMPRQF